MPSTAAVRQACADTLSALWRRGIAAIPLQGKRPSFFLRWKRYQRQLPAWETVQGWLRTGFQSYGILCGAASGGLFALDFDSEERYAAFCQAFPEWRASRTVKTRRGFHVYLQADFAVAPRRFRGCDIQGDGSYVVGPGSLVDGHLYSLQQEAAPKAIRSSPAFSATDVAAATYGQRPRAYNRRTIRATEIGMFGLSVWELLIVLAIVLLLFGPRRLKPLGSDLGSAIKGFR